MSKSKETLMGPQVTSHVEDEALVERRRAQIVTAATELFAKKGFYRTTVKEIAKLALSLHELGQQDVAAA